ncbi:MAG: chemotaxis protein CheW [Chthoniobacter sp.]
MSESVSLVVFRIEKQRYGLLLSVVERIVRAAEVTVLPKAPAMVIGVLDVEGRVLPVLNIRQRLGLPEHQITPAEQFVIARTSRREIVFVVDEALGVIDLPPSGMVNATQIIPGLEQIRGVVQLPDGLVLIHDLEKFLSWEEERALDEALREGATHAS